jgi:protoheme IX farnesyltransferase
MHPYLKLSKARLTLLVLSTTAVGFLFAGRALALPLFLWTLLGTGLAAAGANALNQWVEYRPDAVMERTRERPIPSHRLTRGHALTVGLASATVGVAMLASRVNFLTAALGAFVVLFYLLVYTPLKRRTPLCTLAGAVCGAIPPMMGWTGATGSVGFGAWALALTLFLWQIPHFLALAWLYRDDYARGGFRMLPAVDPFCRITGLLVVLYTVALLPLGLLFFLGGLAGWAFLAGSLALSTGLLTLGLRLQRARDERHARMLFLGSIAYLPLLLGLLVIDRGPAPGMERTAFLAEARPSAPLSPAPRPAPRSLGGPMNRRQQPLHRSPGAR